MASPYICKNHNFKLDPLLPTFLQVPVVPDCDPCVCKCRYGVVLRKLDLIKEAVEVFVEAIHALPLHWGAWLELGNLVTNNEMVKIKAF